MKKLTKKTISGIIAVFGVASLIGLRDYISPDLHAFIMLVILFVSIGRLYLFTQGAPGAVRHTRHESLAIPKFNISKKTISGIIAVFGVASLIGLEYHISPDQHAFIMIAICFVGIGRLYLFTEGATMEDAKHKQLAFRFSIALTFAFLAYVLIIFKNREPGSKFQDYHLALFIISTLTLLAVEWVFGKRSGYTRKNAIKLRDAQSDRLIRLARTIKAQSVQAIAQLNENIATLTQRIGSLESESNAKDLQLAKLNDRLTDLESKPDHSKWLGYWMLDGSKKFRVSSCCNAKAVLPSNRSNSLACPKCKKVIWEREKELSK